MNGFYPVFTKENECQDCYKCIRHCPAKAIKLKNGSASVIPELCVACGRCVKVCPAGAKQIRSFGKGRKTCSFVGAVMEECI